eukprot:TRINITY_DN80589_c0_g1_i1.p1 TRINITY_DN80589_c0_g1~~TRINITY_DN80589_c0_g1_i1.p1  ORF type:complete len:772 (+),score=181.56 TRINITY_DN80589_c0_g1_i1:94-2409(+)
MVDPTSPNPPSSIKSMSTAARFLVDVNKRTEGIGKAAWQLEDTQQDRLVNNYPTDPEAREAYFECAQAEVQYRMSLILLLVLTIFETPTWCNTGPTPFWTYTEPLVQCKIDGVNPSRVLLSNLPYMPLGWGVIMEIYLIFVMARKLLLELRLQNEYFQPLGIEYISRKVIVFGLLMVFIEFIDSAYFIVVRPTFRFAFISRTGFLCLLPPVQKLAKMIVAVLDQFLSIATFFLGAALFFAWIVATIFNDLEGDVPGMPGVPINKGLDTFPHAFYTMLVAGTTDDFVACFLPSYTAYRASGLLWLFFLILVQVLLLSLVLDTLVAAYMSYSEEREEHTTHEKIKGIFAAFKTLSEATGEGDTVSKETFLDFVREFSRSPRTRRIKTSTANIIFAAVDEDGTGGLDKHEFCKLCGVMQYDFWATRKWSFVQSWAPNFWDGQSFTRVRNFVHKEVGFNFDALMNLVLMLNLVLVVVESSYDLNNIEEPFILGHLELMFAFAYVFELFVKLSVYSWGEYVSSFSNKFDFLTTWLLMGSSIGRELLGGNHSGSVRRYMNILRLLRLLRVVKQLKRFPAVTLMVETVYRLVLASTEILTLLGVVVFFFTTLSVQLWGGIIWEGRKELLETEYAENKHWVLNFNDVGMGFGVWVVSLLCEYLPELADVIWEAGGPLAWTWIVFPIFYVFGVSIVFELVKAFTIEVFLGLRKKANEQVIKFQAIEDLHAVFEQDGMSLHTRIIGDESLQDKIVEALEHYLEASEGHEGALHDPHKEAHH